MGLARHRGCAGAPYPGRPPRHVARRTDPPLRLRRPSGRWFRTVTAMHQGRPQASDIRWDRRCLDGYLYGVTGLAAVGHEQHPHGLASRQRGRSLREGMDMRPGWLATVIRSIVSLCVAALVVGGCSSSSSVLPSPSAAASTPPSSIPASQAPTASASPTGSRTLPHRGGRDGDARHPVRLLGA